MLAHAPSYWVTWFPGSLLAFFGVMTLLWKGVEQAVEAKRTLRDVRLALPKIEAQFSRNGGTSMRDRVEKLHDKQDELRWENGKWQRQHARDDDRRFAKVEAALERIEDKLGP